MRFVLGCIATVALGLCLSGCDELQERFRGYPTQDTALNLDTASPNQIADALSQMARISTIGDDWEFLDPNDMCTVHVIDKTAQSSRTLDLRNAEFALQRDTDTQRYYAIMRHGETVVKDGPQPLRLFEGSAYHDVFFAEGYLQALAKRCAHSRQLQARHSTQPSS